MGAPRAWAQSSPIRLVSHGDTSGVNANQYKPWIAGAQAVFERANKSGGVGGRPIELIVRDTGGKPKVAEELTVRSIAEDNATAFFGFGGGPVVKAVLPLIDKARMPLLASFSGADELHGVTPYMFHIRPSFKVEVAHIVQQMQTIGLKRVSVAAIDRPIGSGGVAQIEKLKAESGIEWMIVPFKQDLSDMGTAVASLLKPSPQAILVLAPSGPGVELIDRAKKAGYAGSWYGLSALSSGYAHEKLGNRARGIVLTQASPTPTAKTPFIRDDFSKLMAQAGIQSPQVEHVEGYIAARVMLEALKRAGPKIDSAAVVKSLESIRNFDLGGYTVDFGPDKREGSSKVFLTMISRDGRLVE
jgi:ABC-type branched-subunit amino acid transport system substrate-binding protein